MSSTEPSVFVTSNEDGVNRVGRLYIIFYATSQKKTKRFILFLSLYLVIFFFIQISQSDSMWCCTPWYSQHKYRRADRQTDTRRSVIV